MDPHRLGLGVLAHRLEALVTPGTTLLVTAPGLGHVAMVEAIDPDDASLEITAGANRGVEVLGPDARCKAINRIIGLGDGVVDVAEGDDGAHRAKDLLSGDPHRVVDIGEERRLDVTAFLQPSWHAASFDQLGAFLLAGLDIAEHAI